MVISPLPVAPFLGEESRNFANESGFFFFLRKHSGFHSDLKLKIIQKKKTGRAGAASSPGVS